MIFIVANLIGTPPLLAAKGLSASHLRCVKAAKRPQGLGLDAYRRNTLVYALQGDSVGLQRMNDIGESCRAQVLMRCLGGLF
jgi:hypothetical protein